MNEIWRKIPGFGDAYSASSLGRIMRTSPRNIPWRGSNPKRASRAKPFRPTEVRAYKNRNGYMQVRIGPRGAQRTTSVHQLVARAFIPNPDGMREVNHRDGVKVNNASANLEWSNRSDNLRHAVTRGLQPIPQRGERHANAKLKEADIPAIREDNRILRLIAADYGIHLSLVYLIKHRKVWAHIPD